MTRSRIATLSLIFPLALAACNPGIPNVDEAGNNAADPALASALQDQIMVDPQLGRQANGDAIRPPGQPYSGGVPNDAVATNTDQVDTAGMMKTPPPVASGKARKRMPCSSDSR